MREDLKLGLVRSGVGLWTLVIILLVLKHQGIFNVDASEYVDNDKYVFVDTVDSIDTSVVEVDMVVEKDKLRLTGTELILEHETTSNIRDSFQRFVELYAERNEYSSIEVIECVVDDMEGYGLSIGLVFDNRHYVCIRVDDDSYNALVLYDCELTQSLIEYWEYN